MNPVLRLSPFIAKSRLYPQRNLSIQKDDKNRTDVAKDIPMDDLTEPTNCCMSGCANCVWIQYAERLSSAIEAVNVDLQKAILEKVQDPNMRAFLMMELRCRKLIK
ncbi:Oxidoreductase-like domain-containing protein 1 [Formica fusca]